MKLRRVRREELEDWWPLISRGLGILVMLYAAEISAKTDRPTWLAVAAALFSAPNIARRQRRRNERRDREDEE